MRLCTTTVLMYEMISLGSFPKEDGWLNRAKQRKLLFHQPKAERRTAWCAETWSSYQYVYSGWVGYKNCIPPQCTADITARWLFQRLFM